MPIELIFPHGLAFLFAAACSIYLLISDKRKERDAKLNNPQSQEAASAANPARLSGHDAQGPSMREAITLRRYVATRLQGR